MKLGLLFQTKYPLKLKKYSGRYLADIGFKQVIENEAGEKFVGRNHSYGTPVWFDELIFKVNKAFKEGQADSAAVWVSLEGNPRGVIEFSKKGKSIGIEPWGNISSKTLKEVTYSPKKFKRFEY